MTEREIIHCVRYSRDRLTLCGLKATTSALDLFSGSWQNFTSKFSRKIPCSGCGVRGLREALTTKSITDEDKEFIKEMKKRMPHLSIREQRRDRSSYHD